MVGTPIGRAFARPPALPTLHTSLRNPAWHGEFLRKRRSAMTTIHAGIDQLSPSEHQVQLRRAVIASTIGTAIEWYDFFLYSTVTGLVFAKLFFPHSDPW